ncbi:hypothetical protein J1N35_040925 [Gossypium stocksii]|uniref:Uncharacterized protein n=1 Tax=Gossypium stocksii TaxID=47602 RepID=A0A9D3UEI3_9ROSI|nr:hypothetical protein J1N35_040925 [Gossypium stocksii]
MAIRNFSILSLPHLFRMTDYLVFVDGKGGAGDKVIEKVTVEIECVVSALKFKWRKVSAVWDIPRGCGRVTAPNIGLSRQIVVDQSSQGKWQSISRLSGC